VAEADSVRIEIAFDGGQIMSAMVRAQDAEELERLLAAGGEGTYALDVSDGRYSVVLRRVVYLKRHGREARVGFGI
jgi:hypothetical protein